MSKKNLRPVIVALIVMGDVPSIDHVQLKATKVLLGGGVGRPAQGTCRKLRDGADDKPVLRLGLRSLRMRMSSTMR